MAIDSFGYQVMSLREAIAELQGVAETLPELLDKPLWTSNIRPVHMPLKGVKFSAQGTHLTFETGGN